MVQYCRVFIVQLSSQRLKMGATKMIFQGIIIDYGRGDYKSSVCVLGGPWLPGNKLKSHLLLNRGSQNSIPAQYGGRKIYQANSAILGPPPEVDILFYSHEFLPPGVATFLRVLPQDGRLFQCIPVGWDHFYFSVFPWPICRHFQVILMNSFDILLGP